MNRLNALLAASLALASAVATPARADDRDVITGLLTAIILDWQAGARGDVRGPDDDDDDGRGHGWSDDDDDDGRSRDDDDDDDNGWDNDED
jgi:hypothetical protein